MEINHNMEVDTADRSETSFPVQVASETEALRQRTSTRSPSQKRGVSAGRSSPLERWLMRRALLACGSPALRIVLWDGETIASSSELPVGNILVHTRAALRRLILDPRLAFGDGYSEG